MTELVPILQMLAVILILSWMWAQVLNYADWRIRKRRMWKQIEKRIQR